MDFAYGETVERWRAIPILDPYSGEQTENDWDNRTELPIEGCAIVDGGSLEPVTNARNPVESDFDILAPFGSDVLATDRVVVRGLVCQVQGRPFDWHHPMTGWEPGMVIKAKIVEG